MKDALLNAHAIISVLIVSMFGGVLILLLMHPIIVDGSLKDILLLLLGALTTNFTNVVGYYMGSSTGSAAKDETIRQMVTGTGDGTTTRTTTTNSTTTNP